MQTGSSRSSGSCGSRPRPAGLRCELPLRRGRRGLPAAVRATPAGRRDRPPDGRLRRPGGDPRHRRHARGERALRGGPRPRLQRRSADPSPVGEREPAVGEAGETQLCSRHLGWGLFPEEARGSGRRQVVAAVPEGYLHAGGNRLGRLALRVIPGGAIEDLRPARPPIRLSNNLLQGRMGQDGAVGIGECRLPASVGDSDPAHVR